MCIGNIFHQFCLCIWHMCAMVYLWKSEYSFQELAHPFLLWGSRTEIQVISTWQSPLISEPPHWLRRLHFFFPFKIKLYGVPKKTRILCSSVHCQELLDMRIISVQMTALSQSLPGMLRLVFKINYSLLNHMFFHPSGHQGSILRLRESALRVPRGCVHSRGQ